MSRRTASVTEIHLDAALGASGGHVIVNATNGNTVENRAFVETLRKYSSVWGGVSRTNGLSYRSDLLNLNVLERRNVPYRLVELGFITNYVDVLRLRTNLDALAKSMIENATGEKIN
ncbi:N-acetylmuramoyl-L-alanine amidase [Enterococcus olivae]